MKTNQLMVEIGKEPIPVETAALRYARGNLRKHEQGPAGSSRVEKKCATDDFDSFWRAHNLRQKSWMSVGPNVLNAASYLGGCFSMLVICCH